jgi:hypothetical protein
MVCLFRYDDEERVCLQCDAVMEVKVLKPGEGIRFARWRARVSTLSVVSVAMRKSTFGRIKSL